MSEENKVENSSSDLALRKEEFSKNIHAKELIDAEISHEMRKAYIDYAMSVIVDRALPAAEDGLKPVHRRILWAMYTSGLLSNKPTRKSAKIVGETMGNYHPHGDSAIYDTLVRMAQDFSLRYPLVKGQGNFGSLDGDPAAAMRYTEAKMAKIAEEILVDIDKKTVEMLPNFDNSLEEPKVMPAKLPNLLLNGASGIAVGMATNIPTHNLTDVCDTALAYIDNPEVSVEELTKVIKAPDFPTGGYVSGELKRLYSEGKARLVLKGRTKIEEGTKPSIIITEIPYQVNKASLVEQIAELVRDKKLPDITDLRDESAKGKIRIVVELRKGSDPKFTLNRLLKFTKLQTTFDANILALVNGEPKQLNIKQIIEVYVNHRRKIVRKSTEFDLDKAQKRLHIVDGLLIAQKNIDAVVKLIRAAKTKTDAGEQLKEKYKLSDKQIEAILEMKLHQITSLEHERLTKEFNELNETIVKLEKILSDEKEILKIIKKDLNDLKRDFGDDRRTIVTASLNEDFAEKDLVDKKDVVITITDKGYIKRIDLKQYKEQNRGGKGVIGTELATGDFVKDLLTCSTHDYLLLFTDKGKVQWMKAFEVPEIQKYGKGKALVNMLELKEEKVTSVIAVKEFKDFLFMVTKEGTVKKIELKEFSNPRKGGIKAIDLEGKTDSLVTVKPILEHQEVLLVTKDGQACRFNSDNVRSTGRSSYGVIGINLEKGDQVVSAEVIPEDKKKFSILTITKKGYGKRSEIEDYRLTSRGGKGVINLKATDKTGEVITSQVVTQEDTIIVTTGKGIVIRTPVTNIRIMGRATQGVRIIKLADGDLVTDLARVPVVEDNKE